MDSNACLRNLWRVSGLARPHGGVSASFPESSFSMTSSGGVSSGAIAAKLLAWKKVFLKSGEFFGFTPFCTSL